uniref:Uncharacterized protein LOC104232536 n=1 Tax=Nicotiana sylvestris TaxID=4096 RepID=A0A1U7WVX7_NICSY|nr:PREDICTED: uncharacterized protein LOC104232536 [Nicotiana sylvestris]
MKGEKLDDQFVKFLEILKQIHISIPFTDALLQMPSYAKFLKEILSSKRKLEEVSVVMLTEKWSAILQNKIPQKLGDPGSFTISCTLGGVYFEKALCDSGASINLMPFSIFRKLDLGEMKDISVSLQFAYQSTKKPKGIIKNVLVRLDKFVFPVDFIVLEMKECPDKPIILGRPFFATGRAIIDVHQGQLILRVDEERVIFYMQKIQRFSGDEASSSCFSIDMISDLADEFKDDQLIFDSMERCLTESGTAQDDNPTIRREAKILEKDSEDKEIQSEEVKPKIELKVFPSHLKYVYIEQEQFPVIISSSLTAEQEERQIQVLKSHKGAIGWTVEDIKGISPAIWYNQIPISPEDQDKTTFTCPHGTYAYRRMPFEGIILAHKIIANGIEVDKAKINLIAGLPPPTTVKGIRRFLGHAGDCMIAFNTLKEKLSTASVVVSPDWSQPFEVMCDASDTTVGAVLGQRKDKIFHPIYYARTKVTVFTNHAALKYLLAKKDALPRLLRWILLLQKFDLEIKDKKGTENQILLTTWLEDGHSKISLTNYFIRRCVHEEEMTKSLDHCHDGAIGGYYAANRTTFKVLEVGFFWPTLFKDGRAYVAQCDRCQKTGNITKRDEMPLQSIQVNKLEELRLEAYENARIFKEKIKIWHDKLIRQKSFKIGDQVLLYNSRLRLFPGKLKSRWTDPYNVTDVTSYGAIEIQQINGGDKFKIIVQPGHPMKASTKTEPSIQE